MPRSPYYPSGSVWTINGSQLNQIATACHGGIAFGRRHPEDYPPIMNDNLEKLVKTLN